ncbi:hypothetical protein BDQ17DRAFT_1423673 [Cyathus striatus]|nr:hypothetical protein BDQ17DRAFT_1423673 [Cyathus striatus]
MTSFSASPFSSPSSSPLLCPDSSPPSSPSLDPLALSDSEPSSPPVVAHPLAASFKANRTPPQYEKHGKRRRSNVLNRDLTPKKPKWSDPAGSPRLFMPRSDSFAVNSPPEDAEDAIWDAAVEEAMETGVKKIDLMNCQLTRIPKKFVIDLEKIVVLPGSGEVTDSNTRSIVNAATSRSFGRVHTVPASVDTFRIHAASERARSIGYLPLTGLSPNSVQIFLSGNSISQLPAELWGLTNLTVLSLRGNLLRFVPPEIVRLTSLRTLNLANNKLSYLPAEMLDMQLQEICIHPNPFMQPASPSRSLEKPISEVTGLQQGYVPSLGELCLRTLLTQHRSYPPSSAIVPEPQETVLAALYDLPFPEDFRTIIPPHLRSMIEACLPGSINTPDTARYSDSTAEDRPTGIGICQNPRHRAQRKVFIYAAEYRFSWESKVAGQPAGGSVPVRWRGCLRGCLDFLSCINEDMTEKMPIDNEDDEVVKTVKLASGSEGFGDEDFD